MTTITQYTIGMSNIFILEGKKKVLVDTGSGGGGEAFSDICREHGIKFPAMHWGKEYGKRH